MGGVVLETFFALSNLLVMPFWLLMIFLPGWRLTGRLMRSPLVSAGPALLYAVLIVPLLPEHFPTLLRPELHAVAALLGSPEGAAISWAHFLAFDLFVGRWIYLDSRRRGISAWVTAPVLFVTLMLGPCGFLLHLCLRKFLGRDDDTAAGPASDSSPSY
jgi:hypothetical protein